MRYKKSEVYITCWDGFSIFALRMTASSTHGFCWFFSLHFTIQILSPIKATSANATMQSEMEIFSKVCWYFTSVWTYSNCTHSLSLLLLMLLHRNISKENRFFFFTLLWCTGMGTGKKFSFFFYDIIEFNDWQMYLGKLLYVHKNINIIMFVFRQKRGTRERMQPHPAPVLQPRGKNWPTNSTSVNEHLRPTTTRTG